MFDHLSLGVRDLSAARRFYDAFFAPLGANWPGFATLTGGHARERRSPADVAFASTPFSDALKRLFDATEWA
jgi:catechol 2,3-dioxygenase-like lactoylglutathione lyase family enzyme